MNENVPMTCNKKGIFSITGVGGNYWVHGEKDWASGVPFSELCGPGRPLSINITTKGVRGALRGKVHKGSRAGGVWRCHWGAGANELRLGEKKPATLLKECQGFLPAFSHVHSSTSVEGSGSVGTWWQRSNCSSYYLQRCSRVSLTLWPSWTRSEHICSGAVTYKDRGWLGGTVTFYTTHTHTRPHCCLGYGPQILCCNKNALLEGEDTTNEVKFRESSLNHLTQMEMTTAPGFSLNLKAECPPLHFAARVVKVARDDVMTGPVSGDSQTNELSCETVPGCQFPK